MLCSIQERSRKTSVFNLDQFLQRRTIFSRVLQFRLASSDETRVLDSFTSLTARLNLSCITKFHRGIEKDAEAVARQRETRCEPEGIYAIFLQKVTAHSAFLSTLILPPPSNLPSSLFSPSLLYPSSLYRLRLSFSPPRLSLLPHSFSTPSTSHFVLSFSFLLAPFPQLNLAVAYEMTLQNEEALQLYHEASAALEEALSMFGEEKDSVPWVERIRKAPCTSWDYPKLVWSNLAWRVSTSNSHLTHSHLLDHSLFLRSLPHSLCPSPLPPHLGLP